MTTSLIPAAVLVLLVTGAAHAQATQPASRPATNPITLRQAFTKLPRDARPVKGEWTSFTAEKAQQWLTQQLAGQPLDDTFKIHAIEAKAGADGAWLVTVTIATQIMDIERAPQLVNIAVKDSPRRRSLVFSGDEAFARELGKCKTGDPIRLRGLFGSAEVRRDKGTIVGASKSEPYAGSVALLLESAEVVSAGTYRPAVAVQATTRPARR